GAKDNIISPSHTKNCTRFGLFGNAKQLDTQQLSDVNLYLTSGTDNLFISPTTIDEVTNSEIANNNSTKPVGWLFKMTGAWVVDYNFSVRGGFLNIEPNNMFGCWGGGLDVIVVYTLVLNCSKNGDCDTGEVCDPSSKTCKANIGQPCNSVSDDDSCITKVCRVLGNDIKKCQLTDTRKAVTICMVNEACSSKLCKDNKCA
ncbi:8565_t:CDS:2, partial [Entrophospora sp. SA101]